MLKGKFKEKNNTKMEKNVTKNSTESLSKKICILIIIFLIFVIAFATSSIYIGKDKQKLSKVKLASATDGITTSTSNIDTSNWGTEPEMSEEISSEDGKIKLRGILYHNHKDSSTLKVNLHFSSDYCIKNVIWANKPSKKDNVYENKKVYENNNINTTSIKDDLSNDTSWMNLEIDSLECTYDDLFKSGMNFLVNMASGEQITLDIPVNYFHMYNTPPTAKIVVSNTSKQIMNYELLKITCESTDKENDKITYEWDGRIKETSTYATGKHTIKVKVKDEWGAESDWATYSFEVLSNEIKIEDNDSIIGKVQNINENGIKEIETNGKKYSADCVTYNGNLVLDGTNTIDGVSLLNNIYEVGDESDCATQSEYAKNMVILKVNGDLTINSGITLTACKNSNGYGGPKGLLIFCTGKLTNNGIISMTARGAKAEGQDVYLWKKSSRRL